VEGYSLGMGSGWEMNRYVECGRAYFGSVGEMNTNVECGRA